MWFNMNAFYWTAQATDIVKSGQEESGWALV
jgi:hypothetical protein